MAETFIPTTIEIDGVEVPIRIVRFDFDSKTAFTRDFGKLEGIYLRAEALTRLALSKAALPTKPDPPDPVPMEESVDVQAARRARNAEKLRAHADNITLALALRELEDTPAQRAQRDVVEAENDGFAARFVTETFERFVSVDPAYELIDADGRRVQSGLDLLRSYPTRGALFSAVLYKVHAQTSLAADLKKKLASPSASAPSSPGKSERSPTANGDPPVPIAAAVSTAISVESEDVTA